MDVSLERTKGRLGELGPALVFLLASLAITWPMAAHFTTRLGGDPGDPFQTLWSWRWMHDALISLKNPFFTDRVFFPQGSTLVFETFDLPTAVLTVPLWWVLPPFGVYNAGVLFAFWLTAFGMYRLVRELTGDRLVAICMGVLFTAVPYHLAHAQGHQHLTSMGWLPLYLVFLHRVLDGSPRLRDAVLGGLFLALASLASWYHLLYALVLTPFLFAEAALRSPGSLFSKRFARSALVLAAAFLALAGPLLLAVLRAKASEPVAGAHDAVRFSGDLQAFFYPNLAQRWGHWLGAHAFHWTGNSAETALYAGYLVLAAALAGVIFGGSRARAYFALALAGAVLALGPYLHVAGVVRQEIKLPYLLLEKALPQLEFMGVPVRLGYVMYLGLLVSAAIGLARLRARVGPRALRAGVALVPAALALVEYTPRPFWITQAEPPKPMLEWAQDPRAFAVLDISGDYRMMWHATVHRKPMTGGNLTRVPRRLEQWYWDLPIVRALRRPSYRQAKMLQGARSCGLSAEEGKASLRAIGVRFVITGMEGNDCLERELALPEVYKGEGVRIYELRDEAG
jgi:hypothetical protein